MNRRRVLIGNQGNGYLQINDAVAAEIIATNWGDGIGITAQQAASVTSIGNEFQASAVQDMSCLQYFTGLRTLGTNNIYAKGCFYNCTSLRKVIIPEGVTTLGNGAFLSCTSLQEVSLPSTLTSLPDNQPDYRSGGVFGNCTSLSTVNINYLTALPENCFDSAKITSIHIPASMNSINCTFNSYVKTFTVDPANTVYVAEDNIWYNKAKTVLYQVFDPNRLSLNIANSVLVLSISAMQKCDFSNSLIVDIPASVTYIQESALRADKTFHFLGETPPTIEIYNTGRYNTKTYYYFGDGSSLEHDTAVLNTYLNATNGWQNYGMDKTYKAHMLTWWSHENP